jgi:hypothetical protein
MIKFLSEPEYINNRNKVQSASLITNLLFSALVILLLLFVGQIFVKWLNAPSFSIITLGHSHCPGAYSI